MIKRAPHTGAALSSPADGVGGVREVAERCETRLAFEFAIVAQWIHMTGDLGLDAFFDIHDLRQAQIGAQAVKAGFHYPPDLIVQRPPATSEGETLKRFEQVCEALQGGNGLYFLYRVLSSACHPTGSALSRWLGPDDNPTGLRFIRPDDPPDRTQLYALAASLIWVGRAVDVSTKHRPRQNALKTAAEHADVPSVLKLGV